jgi:hypothetical protein
LRRFAGDEHGLQIAAGPLGQGFGDVAVVDERARIVRLPIDDRRARSGGALFERVGESVT